MYPCLFTCLFTRLRDGGLCTHTVECMYVCIYICLDVLLSNLVFVFHKFTDNSLDQNVTVTNTDGIMAGIQERSSIEYNNKIKIYKRAARYEDCFDTLQ